jgi:hypothetical protein
MCRSPIRYSRPRARCRQEGAPRGQSRTLKTLRAITVEDEDVGGRAAEYDGGVEPSTRRRERLSAHLDGNCDGVCARTRGVTGRLSLCDGGRQRRRGADAARDLRRGQADDRRTGAKMIMQTIVVAVAEDSPTSRATT